MIDLSVNNAVNRFGSFFPDIFSWGHRNCLFLIFLTLLNPDRKYIWTLIENKFGP